MRVAVTLVIEFTDDEQLKKYADYAGLPEPIRAKDVVGDVRSFACEAVRAAFRHPDAGDATVTIKER
jgi:hypothetical protein